MKDWMLPLLATVLLWGWVFLWPMTPKTGDYDFGPTLVAMAKLAAGVIGTLFFWMLFFASR